MRMHQQKSLLLGSLFHQPGIDLGLKLDVCKEKKKRERKGEKENVNKKKEKKKV